MKKGQEAVQGMVPDAVQAGWRKVFGGKKDDEESELEVDDSLDDIDGASSGGDAERDVGEDEHLLYWEVRPAGVPAEACRRECSAFKLAALCFSPVRLGT